MCIRDRDVTITWKTSDATVLKVDEAGKVTAVSYTHLNLTANLAVDGQKSDTSRWSAPTMKNGTSPNQQQTPQWLEICLLYTSKILVQYNSYDEIRQKMQQKVYYKINRNF